MNKTQNNQDLWLFTGKTPTTVVFSTKQLFYKTAACLFVLMAILLGTCFNAYAQTLETRKRSVLPTQLLRGVVVDNVLQTPIESATVSLPVLGLTTVTNASGAFRFAAVPIGVQQLAITHVSYKEVLLDNINVISGKETVLNITVESRFKEADVVVVHAKSKRNRPLNDMGTVSARAFTMEETQKYAAAVNDPSRMATAFPGVMASDDGNNNIIIRGNSPTGLLWRMEGIDIPKHTLSTSLYQSKYTAADDIERNTRFNGGYIANFIGGKEFVSANGLRTFGINFRTLYAGGLRTTPINMEASRQAGYEIENEKKPIPCKTIPTSGHIYG